VALVGGLFGVCAGFLITVVVDYFGGFPLVFSLKSILISLGISIFVGMIAGIYPAIQGTKYDPVKVLYGGQ
jgi:putative ABC transport system permease protein